MCGGCDTAPVRLTILGSGGALVTPRPGCTCRACGQARARGGRHRRGGPSLYVHDARLLVDAPEDVIPLLDRAGIDRVDHLFLSHWHPDHTAGFRVVEQLRADLASAGARPAIRVWLNDETLRVRGPDWRFWERRGYCRFDLLAYGATAELGPLRATCFRFGPADLMSGLVLEHDGARVLLALDETKDLASRVAALTWTHGCDLAVLECGWFEQDPEGRPLVPPESDLRLTEAGFVRDTLPLVDALRPKQAVLVHLMGCLTGRGPEELDAVAARHPDPPLRFAHDGLTLDLA